MANKRMIILLYTDPIGYADSPPLSIAILMLRHLRTPTLARRRQRVILTIFRLVLICVAHINSERVNKADTRIEAYCKGNLFKDVLRLV
jgi:hypothetical protein